MAAVPPLMTSATTGTLSVRYASTAPSRLLAEAGVLAVIGFGSEFPQTDPRLIQVPLAPLPGPAPCEVWQVQGEVSSGRQGDLAWAHGGGLLMAAARIVEADHGGIEAATEYAYAGLMRILVEHDHPHLLRAWNYLAEINQGDGDDERYRHFSVGRARGIGRLPPERFPAATAIGRLDGVRELVVYLLAGRDPGTPVENPRQVSAYRYPRQYGPVPPSFARGMRLHIEHEPALLISGTSSVRGHETVHQQTEAQIDETLINLDSLSAAAGLGERLPMNQACLKAYLRHADDATAMRERLLRAGLPPQQLLCLHGDICRSDLLVEIDGFADSR